MSPAGCVVPSWTVAAIAVDGGGAFGLGGVRPSHVGEPTRHAPFKLVDAALEETGTVQRRLRDLPSRVGVCFVLALALGLFPRQGHGKVQDKLVASSGGLPLPCLSARRCVTFATAWAPPVPGVVRGVVRGAGRPGGPTGHPQARGSAATAPLPSTGACRQGPRLGGQRAACAYPDKTASRVDALTHQQVHLARLPAGPRVLRGQLGLADPAQPGQHLGQHRGLPGRQRPLQVQPGIGADLIAVGHQRRHPDLRRPADRWPRQVVHLPLDVGLGIELTGCGPPPAPRAPRARRPPDRPGRRAPGCSRPPATTARAQGAGGAAKVFDCTLPSPT
jgi:Insertion element 4 transposase N-terminal